MEFIKITLLILSNVLSIELSSRQYTIRNILNGHILILDYKKFIVNVNFILFLKDVKIF
jgi:hypothetical protein